MSLFVSLTAPLTAPVPNPAGAGSDWRVVEGGVLLSEAEFEVLVIAVFYRASGWFPPADSTRHSYFIVARVVNADNAKFLATEPAAHQDASIMAAPHCLRS